MSDSKLSFSVPIRLPSLANGSHGHWRTIANIRAKQRLAVALSFPPELRDALAKGKWQSVVVVIRRVADRELDSDNMAYAAKSCRDEIAKQLGLKDDRDTRVGWVYQQAKCRAAFRRVEIDFIPMVERPEVRA